MKETHDVYQLDLHDADLLSVGASSDISFLSNFYLSMRLVNGMCLKLLFENCFSVDVNLSQWIEGNDSIRYWSFNMTPNQLAKITHFQKSLPVDICDDFICFSATTNVTGSKIDIISKSVICITE